jgi:hypothetical protein
MTDEELRDHLGPVWDHLIEHGLHDLARERIGALLSTRIRVDWLAAREHGPLRELEAALIESLLEGLTVDTFEPTRGIGILHVVARIGPHQDEHIIIQRTSRTDYGSIGREMGHHLREQIEGIEDIAPPEPISLAEIDGRSIHPMLLDPPGPLAPGDRVTWMAADVCRPFDPRYDGRAPWVGTVLEPISHPSGRTSWLVAFPHHPERLYLVESAPRTLYPGEPITADLINHLTEAVERVPERATRGIARVPNIVLPPPGDPASSESGVTP